MADTTARKYWNRIGYVEIEDADGIMRPHGGSYDGLDFRFEGDKIGALNFKFSVGILGLSSETINQLAVWDVNKSGHARRKIKVYAGYSGDKFENPIFSGIIWMATPTNPPEMWLNFECIPVFDYSNIQTNIEADDGESLGELMGRICGILGYKWKSENWLATTISRTDEKKFTFNDSVQNLLGKFAETFHVRVVADNDSVYVCDERPWIGGSTTGAKLISEETGMLGVSNVNMRGALIRKRLCDDNKLLSWVFLQSNIFKASSGYYVVCRKHFKGQYRGDDWYVDLDTIRRGAQV